MMRQRTRRRRDYIRCNLFTVTATELNAEILYGTVLELMTGRASNRCVLYPPGRHTAIAVYPDIYIFISRALSSFELEKLRDQQKVNDTTNRKWHISIVALEKTTASACIDMPLSACAGGSR